MKVISQMLVVVTLSLTSTVQAGTPNEVVGARPSAMGSAFVGVADDGNALYWNPAGMAFLNHHEITAMSSELFGLGISNNYLGYTYPITKDFAVGLDWFNIGYDDSELDYGFSKFNLGASYLVRKNFSAGLVLKHLNTSVGFDGRSVGTGTGWTGEFGLLYKPSGRVSAGIVANNIFDGQMTYDNGTKALFYEMGIRAGLSYRPINGLLVAADVGDRLHLGGEYILYELLTLRSGIQRDLDNNAETVLSFGAGFRHSPVQIDYSYTDYPHLNSTSRISVSAFFNFGRSLVTIENMQLADGQGLFPSLWQNYEMIPVYQFELQNRSDRPLQCSWEVDLGDMDVSAASGDVVLRAGETKTVYASAHFSEEFWSNPKDFFADGALRTSYSTGRNERTNNREFRTLIYSKGAINWSQGVDRVASFINPQDPEIRKIAEKYISIIEDLPSSANLPTNVRVAMAIFDGLKSHKIRYLADPSNPYEQARSNPEIVDNIQYPFELLETRLGDCDDLTVLYSTLLETVGIQTVIIDVPGHLLMMFDTGIPSVYDLSLMLPRELLVDYGGKVFIPIEVTGIQLSFADAWMTAASTYSRWEGLGELNLVDLRQAWNRFPPVPIESHVNQSTFDFEDCIATIEADQTEIKEHQSKFMDQQYYSRMNQIWSDPVFLNRSALRAVFDGNHTEGKTLLTKALSIDPENNDLKLNLANVFSLERNFDSALVLLNGIDARARNTDYCYNLIMTKSLSVDHSSLRDSGELEIVLDNMQLGAVCTEATNISSEQIRECLAETQSEMGLAGCLGKLVFPSESPMTKGDNQTSAILTESMIPEVRLFRWSY